MKLPYLKFYARDWTSDPQLRMVSLAARGFWLECLCIMQQGNRRGFLETPAGHPIPPEALSRLVGANPLEIEALQDELVRAGIPSIEPETGIWYNRRMVADEAKRVKCSEAGRAGGGSPKLSPSHSPSHTTQDNIAITQNPYKYKGHSKGQSKGQSETTFGTTFKGAAAAEIVKIDEDATTQQVIDNLMQLRPEYARVSRSVWESATKQTGSTQSHLVQAANAFIQADANRHESYSAPARYFSGILKRVLEDAGIATETTAEKVERLRRSA